MSTRAGTLIISAALALTALGGARTAHAQEPAEPTTVGAEPPHNVAGETAEDPSEHFNLWQHLTDYKGLDEYGGPLGDGKMVDEKTGVTVKEEEGMSPPFVAMIFNFGLLLLILGKYGWPSARKLARERHDQIKTALDEAAALRDQAKAKLAEYEKRIKDVDADMAKLVADIKAGAEADKVRILESAEKQAAQLKRDAEARIAAEIESARVALTREVTVAAANATEKLLRDKTTADDQQKLVTTFITGMPTAQGPGEARR